MKFYCTDKEAVLDELGASAEGLTSAEAQKRLEENGKNKLIEGKKESLLHRFLKQLAEPMTIILLVAAAISAGVEIYEGVINNHFEFPTDVIIILAVVLINAILGVLQESKAEKAIEALQEMSKAQSKVLRDGKQISIASEDLVIGDVIILEAGDAVPADARIIECASMKIEEAALTGESVPVDKKVDVLTVGESGDVALGDRKNMVFMGSTVVYGRGKAVVTATGMETEMGKIADALAMAEEGKTPLQIKLAGLSKILTYLVIGICVVIFGVQLIRDGIGFEPILNSFMIAISLAVAAIPEGLATVVTIVLSIGVTNMSKRNAIIRKMTAVEKFFKSILLKSEVFNISDGIFHFSFRSKSSCANSTFSQSSRILERLPISKFHCTFIKLYLPSRAGKSQKREKRIYILYVSYSKKN